jgi:methyl-accepting chemotaxis protein
MNLDRAMQAHVEWKMKLRKAIAERTRLDPARIAQDDQCELGIWLHGDARAVHASHAAYAECIARHAAFHVEASKVAQLINAAQYAEAEAAIGPSTGFAAASQEVGRAILGLKKAAGM